MSLSALSRAILVAAMVLGGMLTGCKGKGEQGAPPERSGEVEDAPLPSYADIARVYNERVDRLRTIWARAVVSVRYTDDRGDRRWEQGNGHFQYQFPSRLALSIGKAGETLIWLGYDEQRFWVFDRQKGARAYVGTHAKLTRTRAAELGIPALPRELPMLMGLSPLPTGSNVRALVERSDDAKLVRVSMPNGLGGVWRLTVDPATGDARRVELLDRPRGERVIDSALEELEGVRLQGVGGFFPKMSVRTRILHVASDTEMLITLDDQQEREIKARVFDFEGLTDALGPVDVIDVDQEAAR